MATIEEFTDGFPNCNGRIPLETALLPEVLAENGYNTYCVGKWHLTPLEESNLAATQTALALLAGFERFYGFMGGETDQWYPDLVYDNHPVDPPGTPEEGYHLSRDLADKTIEFIRDAKVIAPDKPWFTYLLPGCRPRPASCVQGVGGPVCGAVRHGLRGLPRHRAGEPETAGHRSARHRAVTGQSLCGCPGAQRRTLARPGHRAAVGHA